MHGGKPGSIFAQQLAQLVHTPKVISAFTPLRIGIQGCIEATLRAPQLAFEESLSFSQSPKKNRFFAHLKGFCQYSEQQSVVVKHFFKMRDAPSLVGCIAGKATAELITDTSLQHFLQRKQYKISSFRMLFCIAPGQHERQRRYLRKFGRTPKSTPGPIPESAQPFVKVLQVCRLILPGNDF